MFCCFLTVSDSHLPSALGFEFSGSATLPQFFLSENLILIFVYLLNLCFFIVGVQFVPYCIMRFSFRST